MNQAVFGVSRGQRTRTQRQSQPRPYFEQVPFCALSESSPRSSRKPVLADHRNLRIKMSSLFSPRDPFEPRRRSTLNPLALLYDMIFGPVLRPCCFPVAKTATRESESQKALDNALEQHQIETLLAKKTLNGEGVRVVAPPPIQDSLPIDPGARSIVLVSRGNAIGKTTATGTRHATTTLERASRRSRSLCAPSYE